jgi:hypothetical protein
VPSLGNVLVRTGPMLSTATLQQAPGYFPATARRTSLTLSRSEGETILGPELAYPSLKLIELANHWLGVSLAQKADAPLSWKISAYNSRSAFEVFMVRYLRNGGYKPVVVAGEML